MTTLGSEHPGSNGYVGYLGATSSVDTMANAVDGVRIPAHPVDLAQPGGL
ncbi:MAG: hypothetical protein ACYC1C_09120 [Chloroflexota bacterium]